MSYWISETGAGERETTTGSFGKENLAGLGIESGWVELDCCRLELSCKWGLSLVSLLWRIGFAEVCSTVEFGILAQHCWWGSGDE